MSHGPHRGAPSVELVAEFFDGLGEALRAVEVSDGQGTPLAFEVGMERAIALILALSDVGGTLFFVGNGGSAAIASHQALDFWRSGRIRAAAFNDPVLLTCLSNDFGYESVFERPVDMFAGPRDILCAISSSGQSANILRAARKAREKGCAVLTMSGFAPDNPLRRLGDLNFYVPSHSYGHVEVAHLSLSHGMLDIIRKMQRAIAPGSSA